MSRLTFTVYGKPAPKGSVRAFVPKKKDGSIARRPDGSPLVVKNDDSGARGKAWMGDVAKACAEAMDEVEMLLMRDVPISISIVFHVVRAKNHYGSGRNSDILKASAPAYPAKRPDVDKWVRSVLDALTGTAWQDDGQVVELHALKVFGDQAKAEVEIGTLRREAEQDDAQVALVVQ